MLLKIHVKKHYFLLLKRSFHIDYALIERATETHIELGVVFFKPAVHKHITQFQKLSLVTVIYEIFIYIARIYPYGFACVFFYGFGEEIERLALLKWLTAAECDIGDEALR